MNDHPWEDNLLERKVESDLKDLLKTLVAFANSVKPEHKAVILIGERDDGTIEGVKNPDNIQKTIRKECEKIYPPIDWRTTVYVKNGNNCVRVEIEYSGDTPHFGGPSWVRKGSDTIKASDEVFQHLINLRNDKVRELSKWIGKQVTVMGDESTIPQERRVKVKENVMIKIFKHRWNPGDTTNATLISVNNFWATFLRHDTNVYHSEPIQKLILNYDDKNIV